MKLGVMVSLIVLTLGCCTPAVMAAEFSLHGPTIELRRLQYCTECETPLVVTTVPPGAAIRCPTCNTVNRRLPNRLLEVRVYQVCPSCTSKLDVAHLDPGRQMRCGTCGLPQYVLPEAVYRPDCGTGRGRAPRAVVVPDADGLAPPVMQQPESSHGATISSPVASAMKDAAPSPTEESTPVDAGSEGDPDLDFLDEEELPELETEPISLSPSGASRSSGRGLKQPPASSVAPDASAAQRPTPSVPVLSAVSRPGTSPDAGGSDHWMDRLIALPTIPVRPLPPREEAMRVAAVVNGEAIYAADVLRDLHACSGAGMVDPARRREVWANALQERIDRLLVVQAARRQGLHPGQGDLATETAAKTPDAALREWQYNAMIAMKQCQGAEPDEEALRAWYRSHASQFRQPTRAAWRSLMIYDDREGRRDTRPSAMIAHDVREQLDRGVDFSALVRRYSEGPFREQGGRWTQGDTLMAVQMLAPSIRQAVAAEPSAEVHGPVRLATGVAFFAVDRTDEGRLPPLAEVEDRVRAAYCKEMTDAQIANWTSQLRRQAVIEAYAMPNF